MSYGYRGELETHREDSSHQEQEARVFNLVTSSATCVPGSALLPGLHLFCLSGKEAQSRYSLCRARGAGGARSG